MVKHLTMAAAVMAGMMYVSQPTFARDQVDASGTGNANDNADVASPGAAADAAAQPADAAAQPAAAREGQAGQVSQKDQRFVMKAASSGMFEVASSQLALKQAQGEEVKRMAQQMIEDHQQANQQLMQLAQQKGIQIPKQMMPVHQAMLQDLQQHQGKDFDQAYLIDQVAEHNKAVLKFRNASTELQDSDLKQFAAQTLPKLREHLAHVEQAAGVDQETTAGSREGAAGHGEDHAAPAAGERQAPDAGAGAGSGAGAGAGAGAGTAAEDAATDRNAR